MMLFSITPLRAIADAIRFDYYDCRHAAAFSLSLSLMPPAIATASLSPLR